MKRSNRSEPATLMDWIKNPAKRLTLFNTRTGLIILGVFAAVFILATVLHYVLATLDKQIETWIFFGTTRASFTLFNRITKLGESILLGPIALMMVLWWIFRKNWDKASFLGLSVLGGGILTLLLKLLFQSERPNLITGWVNKFDFGFPSGHAVMSFLFWGSIAYLFIRRNQNVKVQWLVMGCAGFISFVVGLSRLFLGVHFPLDVLGGWSWAVMWLTFSILVVDYTTWKRHLPLIHAPVVQVEG